MRHNIVVLDGYTLTPNVPGSANISEEPCWDALEKLGDLAVYPRTSPAEVDERIADATIVLTNKTKLTGDTLRQAKRLRSIAVMATGVNVIDMDAADELQIEVKNAPGYGADSVAQHVFALILEFTNQIAAHHASVSRGEWAACKDFSYSIAPLTELRGKSLGVVGLGTIGQKVAALGHAFGMKILAAHQRSMHDIHLPGIEIDWRPLEQLVPASDVLTLHCPLTDATRQLIDADRLTEMKSTALLINTGRGDLIDEHALADALRSGQIAGAGLDVLCDEPPGSDNPLTDCPNAIVTPHIAWATREARHRLMNIVVDNVQKFCG